jgi:hypothetical protein
MKKRAVLLAVLLSGSAMAGAPKGISGFYPSLAMFNAEGECGTGAAVVPWAGSLWAITCAPHAPYGSSDKLYEITADLRQIIRPESVRGTPACRMIHEETNQLLIGLYLIDESKNVRTIPASSARKTAEAPSGSVRRMIFGNSANLAARVVLG